MAERRGRVALGMLLVVLLLGLAGCGDTSGPCDYSDPIGPCATSHGRTHG